MFELMFAGISLFLLYSVGRNLVDRIRFGPGQRSNSSEDRQRGGSHGDSSSGSGGSVSDDACGGDDSDCDGGGDD